MPEKGSAAPIWMKDHNLSDPDQHMADLPSYGAFSILEVQCRNDDHLAC